MIMERLELFSVISSMMITLTFSNIFLWDWGRRHVEITMSIYLRSLKHLHDLLISDPQPCSITLNIQIIFFYLYLKSVFYIDKFNYFSCVNIMISYSMRNLA